MKAYFFDICDGEGIAIIAENTREARKIAVHHNEYYSYIDMCRHIRLIKHADVSGLTKGLVDDQVSEIERVRRGFYGWTIGKCPKCGIETELYLQDDGEVCCNQCQKNKEATK